MQSTQDILNEREQQYGSYASFCEINGALRKVSDKHVGKLTLQQQTAVEMMLFKIARILNNGANHQDNWQDIAGYAMVGGELFEPQLSSNTLQLPKPLTKLPSKDTTLYCLDFKPEENTEFGMFHVETYVYVVNSTLNDSIMDNIYLKNRRLYRTKEEVIQVIEAITGKPYEDR